MGFDLVLLNVVELHFGDPSECGCTTWGRWRETVEAQLLIQHFAMRIFEMVGGT